MPRVGSTAEPLTHTTPPAEADGVVVVLEWDVRALRGP